MMIRILCLSVLVMLFCTDIEAGKEKHKKLKCFTCKGKYCSKYRDCKHGQVCMSASVVELTHGKKEKSFYRACTSPSYCGKLGKKGMVSIGVGHQVFVATVKCCDSHLCNKKLPRYPKIPSGNGLKCLFCNNTKHADECKVKECIGKQSFCLKVKRNGIVQSGCATEKFCQANNTSGYWPGKGFAGAFKFPAMCEKAKPEPEPTTPEPTTEPTTAEPIMCIPIETTPKPTTPKPTHPPCGIKG